MNSDCQDCPSRERARQGLRQTPAGRSGFGDGDSEAEAGLSSHTPLPLTALFILPVLPIIIPLFFGLQLPKGWLLIVWLLVGAVSTLVGEKRQSAAACHHAEP